MHLAQISYGASLRSLDKQDDLLRELRSRTGTLLAASSLAASFLGRPALDADPVALGIAALAAFAVSITASLYVLMPKKTLAFSIKGSGIYESLYEFVSDPPEAQRRVAYDLDRFWDENDAAMQPLFRAFRVAAVALAVEVVLLLSSLTGTLF